ncbi:MAG: MotA/TolQ/ExbB proton channel family protein [Gammaproteobacteria bacterium]|nr:MotA/TolQ/ExbB proton channel family protein [Gammaproteobacteria bacterium]
MKRFVTAFCVAAALLAAPVSAEIKSLDQLLQAVKANRLSDQKINKEREAEFLSDKADKAALVRKARAELEAQKARGTQLQKAFADNELLLAAKEVELENSKGTLGEMFGVVRQAAAETVGRISTSVVSAQYPGRAELLDKLATAKELPTLTELEELWIALQTEMTESGKVVAFDADVVQLEGGVEKLEVIRIGAFNLISGGDYLLYNSDTKQVQPLGRQPAGYITSTAAKFSSTTSGLAPLYVDPSRGQILGLLTAKATLGERFHQGGIVGYVIVVVLIVGLLIALFKLITLSLVGIKIRGQLKNPATPSTNNPLGRVLKVYHDNRTSDVENLELKLDEAVLRETPSIEAGVPIIKIFAAVAPLLGLLGTVVGMIETFQQITLFGTGDPKIMAGSISMALVTTAQGLIAAIPLVLLHSVVAGRAKSIVHILDEQSTGIVAAHAEKERA